jgi:quercetin dioxygenase-like cupin family protein
LSDPERLWFLGTLATILVTGEDSRGKLGVFESLLPRHASPPVHTHPQGETLVVLEGDLTFVLDGARSEVAAGAAVHAPPGHPHTFRVDSESARVLVLSTPAGIESFAQAAGAPAPSAALPPPDAPRPSPELLLTIERQHGMERHGPPLGPDD